MHTARMPHARQAHERRGLRLTPFYDTTKVQKIYGSKKHFVKKNVNKHHLFASCKYHVISKLQTY